MSSELPANAVERFSSNASHWSPGFGGLPMNTINGFGLVFTIGIRLSNALMVSI